MRCMRRYKRSAGASLLVLVLGFGVEVTKAQQSGKTPALSSIPSETTAAPNRLPDSPGAVRFQIIASNAQGSADAAPQIPPAKAPAEQQPVGTAAAESIQTSGVAASAPAGTAIAPAKQRQVRSLLIKMGAVLGASAAVGTAVALSEATPSKPPGAH
jgi:hypothetical protein